MDVMCRSSLSCNINGILFMFQLQDHQDPVVRDCEEVCSKTEVHEILETKPLLLFYKKHLSLLENSPQLKKDKKSSVVVKLQQAMSQ